MSLDIQLLTKDRDLMYIIVQWDPRNPSVLFLSQSATLYAAYYGLQIAIHRPFIPHPLNSEEPSALSSLASCTTAAKSCVCVLGTLSRRTSPLLATGICDNLVRDYYWTRRGITALTYTRFASLFAELPCSSTFGEKKNCADWPLITTKRLPT